VSIIDKIYTIRYLIYNIFEDDFMKLEEHELVDRYIYYLKRYIPYDKQKMAEDDFLEILRERLPQIYTEDDIKKELNKK